MIVRTERRQYAEHDGGYPSFRALNGGC